MHQSGTFCMAFDLVVDANRRLICYERYWVPYSISCSIFVSSYRMAVVLFICCTIASTIRRGMLNSIYTSIRIHCILCMRKSPWIALTYTGRCALELVQHSTTITMQWRDNMQQHNNSRAAVILNMDMHILAQYIQWNWTWTRNEGTRIENW